MTRLPGKKLHLHQWKLQLFLLQQIGVPVADGHVSTVKRSIGLESGCTLLLGSVIFHGVCWSQPLFLRFFVLSTAPG
jgi:hypothetical protein